MFLQEVVPNVYHYLEKQLPQYMLIASSDTEYFTVTMLLRTIVHFDGHELVDFPGSVMGRNLLVVKVCFIAVMLKKGTGVLRQLSA